MKGFVRRLLPLMLALMLALSAPALARSADEWAGIRLWYAHLTDEYRADLLVLVPEDLACDDVLQVGAHLYLYGRLPGNYITKAEARALGWTGGSLEPYAPGMCIGGDRFGNYEGLLPEGETYTECDIDTLYAKSRGAKRLVFDEGGAIYYTEDHYESFTLLHEGRAADEAP